MSSSSPRTISGPLLAVLERARALGVLGPGPVAAHIDHARAFARLLAPAGVGAGPVVDLGSGGGIPGLVLASDDLARGSARQWLLVDSHARRTAFLANAAMELGISAQVEVWTGRAEDFARGEHRGTVAGVVARSFATPSVLAECAAPLLASGGSVVVSEPPGATNSAERWPSDGLAELGLELDTVQPGPPALVRLVAVGRCPDRFPRRVGVPARRPLWPIPRST